MKVYIEVPDNWIDAESPTLWASTTIRDQVRTIIVEAVSEQLVAKMTLPKIVIPQKELRAAVKEAMVNELVENALRK